MELDFCAYNFRQTDGYGNYCTHLLAALHQLDVHVIPLFPESVGAPAWLKSQWGIRPGTLTISCLPPFYLQDAPSGGRHWLLSMTEGSQLPGEIETETGIKMAWADIIRSHNIERVIVPCEHNAQVFREALPGMPVHVVPGGVDPDEFPVRTDRETGRQGDKETRPYTFLSIADRGARKGWCEVWSSFYKAFGTADQTPNVRLIIKARPDGNDMLDMVARAENPDPRVTIIQEDMDMRDVYGMADCFAIPSRSEGWGMPHREAACMGLPVITQVYSGMDDGHTACWAIPLWDGRLEPIPSNCDHMAGVWMRADTDELAAAMKWHYDNPERAAFLGRSAATWLRQWQTWEMSAKKLIDLIQEYA